jgi:hypothetical protein
VAAALAGCASSEREQLSEARLNELAAQDSAQWQQEFHDAVGRLMARTEREVDSATSAAPATLDILALTGGGDYGAFGAGALVGWGQAADPAWRRPDFDAVTGVSTGAMLAPFAYVGTDESCAYVENFYRNPQKDWVKERGILFFLPSNASFMTIPGLDRDLNSAMARQFVEKIAERSRSGKLLAITATNLDLGRQRVWDVGAAAEAAVASGDYSRLVKFMFASSAIPAAFPPVEIDGFLYADGGVSANVFLRLDVTSPDAMLPRWWKAHPGKPMPKVRYWIIVNNQLKQPPKTVQPKWPSVIAPSLATAIRSATISEIRWLAARADHVNAAYGTAIEVRVLAIPEEWRAPVQGDFQKETMASLADIGRLQGADPSAWKLWTMPARNAPAAAASAGGGTDASHLAGGAVE